MNGQLGARIADIVAETGELNDRLDELCLTTGRDPATLRRQSSSGHDQPAGARRVTRVAGGAAGRGQIEDVVVGSAASETNES